MKKRRINCKTTEPIESSAGGLLLVSYNFARDETPTRVYVAITEIISCCSTLIWCIK